MMGHKGEPEAELVSYSLRWGRPCSVRHTCPRLQPRTLSSRLGHRTVGATTGQSARHSVGPVQSSVTHTSPVSHRWLPQPAPTVVSR
jgi:hypothetical protein